MIAKPIKTLELHYPIIQFLIIKIIYVSQLFRFIVTLSIFLFMATFGDLNFANKFDNMTS